MDMPSPTALTILVRRSSEYGFMLDMVTRSAIWVNGYGVCCRVECLRGGEVDESGGGPERDACVADGRAIAGRWCSVPDPTRSRLRCPRLPVRRSEGRAGAWRVFGRSQADPRRHHGAWLIRAVAAQD